MDSERLSDMYETQFGVYFDDLDAFQILHNSRYLLLFERAIGEFWSQHFGWSPLLSKEAGSDQCHLVRANHLEYLRPVRGVGSVTIRLFVTHLGDTSVRFGARFLLPESEVLCATAERVLVKVHPETQLPIPWSDGFRAVLRRYLAVTDS